MWISTCVCGHEEEEHQGGYGECTVEGCLCAGYEPEGEIADDWFDEDEEAGPVPTHFERRVDDNGDNDDIGRG